MDDFCFMSNIWPPIDNSAVATIRTKKKRTLLSLWGLTSSHRANDTRIYITGEKDEK